MNKQFNSLRYKDKFKVDKMDAIRIKIILHMIGKNKRVLDLGCGDGFIMKKIKSAPNDVEGVEISTNAIKAAREKGFKVYDIDLNTNWAHKIHGKFDVVLGGEIIEHLFDTDRFIRNIHSVLKKNGKVILTTPNIASLGRRLYLLMGKSPLIETTAHKLDAGHIRYFTHQTLKTLVEDHEFTVVRNESVVVNLDSKARFVSGRLARLFPQIGNNIVLKAIKNDKPSNI